MQKGIGACKNCTRVFERCILFDLNDLRWNYGIFPPKNTLYHLEFSSQYSRTKTTENKRLSVWYSACIILLRCKSFLTEELEMIALPKACSSGLSQGHAKFVQRVIVAVARWRYYILLVEKFSALLLWPRKGAQLMYGRTSRESI